MEKIFHTRAHEVICLARWCGWVCLYWRPTRSRFPDWLLGLAGEEEDEEADELAREILADYLSGVAWLRLFLHV